MRCSENVVGNVADDCLSLLLCYISLLHQLDAFVNGVFTDDTTTFSLLWHELSHLEHQQAKIRITFILTDSLPLLRISLELYLPVLRHFPRILFHND